MWVWKLATIYAIIFLYQIRNYVLQECERCNSKQSKIISQHMRQSCYRFHSPRDKRVCKLNVNMFQPVFQLDTNCRRSISSLGALGMLVWCGPSSSNRVRDLCKNEINKIIIQVQIGLQFLTFFKQFEAWSQ